jgi:hypothetical protein
VIYTNLNETEIEKISAILNQCKVEYHVSENEMALRALTEGDTYKQTQKSGRRGMPIMQIEFENSEWSKIPENLKGRLHGLGVFEDVENPFSEEELNQIGERNPGDKDIEEEDDDPREKMKQMVSILGVLALGLLYLIAKEKGWV